MENTWEELKEPKKCPVTQKMYDAIQKVPCSCICHRENATAMHIFPCCDDGFNIIFRYID